VKDERVVYLEGDDPSFKVWRQTMMDVFADPEFETGFNFLSDRRSAFEPRSAEFIRAAVNFVKAHNKEIGSCKWATVVSTMAAFGMGRMAQILSEDLPTELQLFTDIDKARQWLIEGC
jgi:hypothetical protein